MIDKHKHIGHWCSCGIERHDGDCDKPFSREIFEVGNIRFMIEGYGVSVTIHTPDEEIKHRRSMIINEYPGEPEVVKTIPVYPLLVDKSQT